MADNPEQQPAAVAECGGGDMAAAAVVAPRRKVRMHPDDVRFTLSLKRGEDLGSTEYLDRFAHKLTPEELEEHRRVHEEVAAMFRKDDEEIEARQAQVARELAEKGYVETDEVEPADEEEYDRWASALWESLTDKPCFRRHKAANRDVDDGAPGWTVRPHDAEQDQDEYDDYDDENEDEDEPEVKDEDEQVEAEDGKEDTTNVQAQSDGQTAALNPTTTD